MVLISSTKYCFLPGALLRGLSREWSVAVEKVCAEGSVRELFFPFSKSMMWVMRFHSPMGLSDEQLPAIPMLMTRVGENLPMV